MKQEETITTNNELVYGEQINPLMAQIIEICKEHEIPFACQFALSDEETGLVCTSGMTFESEQIKSVLKTMVSGNSPRIASFTITKSEVSKP